MTASCSSRSTGSAPSGYPIGLYFTVALTSASTNLLITAIAFFTVNRFGWTLKDNFLLSTGQGIFYVGGALLAHPVSQRLERHLAIGIVYSVLSALAFFAFALRAHPMAVAGILLFYSFSCTISWPMMESLVSSDVDSTMLSRRVGMYNLVWSSLGVVMLAIDGTLIARWPAGVFLIPCVFSAISAVVMFIGRPISARGAQQPREPAQTVSHLSPEPQLLQVRTLALWLSRIALPATYVVIFSLMALMPSLPVMHALSTPMQTIVGGAWMTTRMLAFLVLGPATWWHTRPRVLALAAGVMLVAFFAVTIRPSDVLGVGSQAVDLCVMIAAQLALGAALGMIYSGSLYFGMVLSDGSTEHGGYHEALIGVGTIAGSASGALAQFRWPGNVYAGVAAVGSMVFISVTAVAVTAVVANRRGADNARAASPAQLPLSSGR